MSLPLHRETQQMSFLDTLKTYIMKKLSSILVIALLFMGIASVATSCSENTPPELPAAKYVEGTYTGDMTCSVMSSDQTFENLTFNVTATDAGTVTVAIPSFGQPPMQMPAITVPGVKVAGTDGTYALATTSFDGTSDTGRNYSGTLDGSLADGNVTIRFRLNYGAMPMPLICTFVASK